MSAALSRAKAQAPATLARAAPSQAAIKIGRTDDPAEHEAERVAAQLLRTPSPIALRDSPTATSAGSAPPIVHDVLSAPGRPLDETTRSHFEPRLRTNLSDVRVHDDTRAAQSAEAVDALAYTVGNHIAFATGRHSPGAPEGNRLLTHELVHVAQQRGSNSVSPSTSPGPLVQRFTETGHKAIGEAASSRDLLSLGPDIKMSYGDAVAMGDYFYSFDKMRELAAKPGKTRNTVGEVKYVLWVCIWGLPVETKMGDWYDRLAADHAEQRSRHLDATNISHFPNPRTGDTGSAPQQKTQRRDKDSGPLGAASTYREGHEEAIEIAYANGSKRLANDEALVADGFACHFLTDSFSGSHLRTERESIKEYWDAKVPGFHHRLIEWLADRINEESWGAVKRVGAVITGGSIRARAREQLSIELSAGDYSFGNLVSLIVHDAEGAAGVDATIDGAKITLAGDKDLVTAKGAPTAKGKPTFDAAVRAVKASLDDVHRAFDAGRKGENLSAVRKSLQRDGLYAAERLTPTPVPDAQLPPEKRSLPWKQESIDKFLKENEVAIGTWGPTMATEFTKKLDKMRDLRPEAKAALHRALIVPMGAGGKEVARVIKAIASHS